MHLQGEPEDGPPQADLPPGAPGELRLPLTAAAVPTARRAVAAWSRAAGLDTSLTRDMESVASELVTNAVLHASGEHVHVRFASDHGNHRVEVEDHYPAMPTTRAATSDVAGSVGNGLRLLTALATASGVTPTATGKIVWATFGDASADHTRIEARGSARQSRQAQAVLNPDEALRAEVERFEEEAGLTTGAEGEDLMRVRLLGLPLVLFAAQLRHHRELLRELELVARAGGRHRPGGLVELARELIHYRGMGDSTESERAAALKAGALTLDVVYALPRFAGPACDRMVRLLARADAYAREGALLVLPPTPEQVAVREWFLGQITEQCEGAEPRRWAGPLSP